jgi:hypothetical protein
VKLVRYRDGDHVTAGTVVGDHVVALRAIDSAPTDVTVLLEADPEVGSHVACKSQSVARRIPPAAVDLQPPIGRPSKYSQTLAFSLFNDFENFSDFRPVALHDDAADTLFDELESWARAMKSIRT